ncbi:MAG: AraC family transcriptional regulator [Propylenella sp.]
MDQTAAPPAEGRDLQRRAQVVRLARAIKSMLATLDEPFDLDQVARIACLSRFHFVRQFRALTGHSPERFQLRLRLQRAAWSLISGDASIGEIALSAGFESADGFGRAFRRVYEVSPSAFRKLGADPWASFSRFGYWRPLEIQLPSKQTGASVVMELRNLPAMVYAGVRNVGPYHTVGPAFERIVGWAAGAGLMKADTKVIGLAWDNPYLVPAEQLRYDAAVTIDRPIKTPDDIRISALPAMTWAMTQHKGSYARMPESFMALGTEISRRVDLVYVPVCSLEIYLSDPDKTPEAELITDIGMAVVKLG